MRLLCTFGEKRSVNFPSVPTLRELGFNLVVEAPNGIGAPAGLSRAIQNKLRNAFKLAINSEEFKAVAKQVDSPVMYLDGPDYKRYVEQVYGQETEIIRRLKLSELMSKG
jgi:tripartite-type tricarboxylate transporter receptor subunit TctC